ncbi:MULTISPECIES: DUF883 family protein [Prochlorococcus]|uniref:DUF883 family protein n=1 Tax=Prochlorococcus TaxID=1218 RepID=UPI000533AFC7|nr:MULTISPECIES: DUF883 family protein [Prochlorococcus]KGG13331.1 hypothetical protein EV05_1011 [Prochlorococcus sp. MIT 0601]
MESVNSSPFEAQASANTESHKDLSEQWFSDQFDALLPRIQERWPEVAKQTLEATKGSLDEVVRVISSHSGKTSYGVKEQLEELFNSASDRTKDLADSLEPLEKQLEDLLDELNQTLRPRIEKPIRKRPLLAIGIATGLGVLLGILLAGGKRS